MTTVDGWVTVDVGMRMGMGDGEWGMAVPGGVVLSLDQMSLTQQKGNIVNQV